MENQCWKSGGTLVCALFHSRFRVSHGRDGQTMAISALCPCRMGVGAYSISPLLCGLRWLHIPTTYYIPSGRLYSITTTAQEHLARDLQWGVDDDLCMRCLQSVSSHKRDVWYCRLRTIGDHVFCIAAQPSLEWLTSHWYHYAVFIGLQFVRHIHSVIRNDLYCVEWEV